jgi:hypothetical protein
MENKAYPWKLIEQWQNVNVWQSMDKWGIVAMKQTPNSFHDGQIVIKDGDKVLKMRKVKGKYIPW